MLNDDFGLMQILKPQRIGVLYKDAAWAKEVYDYIENFYLKKEYKGKFVPNKFIEVGNKYFYFIDARYGSKGMRCDNLIIQKGIDETIIKEIFLEFLINKPKVVYID